MPGVQQPVTLGGELLEPARVDQVPVGLEDVPISAEQDQLGVRGGRFCGPKRATEPRYVGNERLLRVLGGPVSPELLDEIVDGHDSTSACYQAGEDRSFFRSGDRQRLPACVRDLEGSEDEETHRRRLTPPTHPRYRVTLRATGSNGPRSFERCETGDLNPPTLFRALDPEVACAAHELPSACCVSGRGFLCPGVSSCREQCVGKPDARCRVEFRCRRAPPTADLVS
jgi:hypothetical protein